MSLPYLTPNLIPLRSEAQPIEPYRAAIFFDNDHAKIAQVLAACPTIKGVAVPETHGTSLLGGSKRLLMKFTDEPLKSIISESGGEDNLYIKISRFYGFDNEQFDPVSGISEDHISQLRLWLAETEHIYPRAVIFDWDRTLTKTEGVLLPSVGLPMEPITSMIRHIPNATERSQTDLIEDMLKIMCGGSARLAMLREMFNTIKDSGAHIIILTNNDLCFTYSYKQLLDGLIPKPGPQVYLACSKNPPFFGNKGNRLRANHLFGQVCPIIASPPSGLAVAPKRRVVNLTANNDENLYSGGGGKRRTKRRSRKYGKRSRIRRGKVRKN